MLETLRTCFLTFLVFLLARNETDYPDQSSGKADLTILISAVCILILGLCYFFACDKVLNIAHDRCSCVGQEYSGPRC